MQRVGMLVPAVLLVALALTSRTRAEPPVPPPGLQPIARSALTPDSFDVRAFDPFGMRPGAPTAQPLVSGTRDMAAQAAAAPGFFSDGWSRDGFGGQRRP